jgi:hypothetical protein
MTIKFIKINNNIVKIVVIILLLPIGNFRLTNYA